MKIFTCRICGEIYIGREKPGTCPFCGAFNGFLVEARDWKSEYDVELTETSRKNLEAALALELSNTAFYKCAYETLSNKEVGLMFKGLMKVEREHASVFRKLLKPESDPVVNETCTDDALKTLEESSAREQKAAAFYQKAMSEATEPRLKEVFTAIMRVEQDHLELDSEMKNKLI
jgi:rubrerythrin